MSQIYKSNSGSGPSSEDLHVARYIVSPTLGSGANYTTIASAYAAAVAAGGKQTVAMQPGTYVENITLSPGINLTAFNCDAATGSVVISGTLSASFAGDTSISGINLQTNGNYCVSVSGSSATIVNLINCDINATNHTPISLSSSNSSSQIYVQDCFGNLGTTGISMITNTGNGAIFEDGCIYTNTGNSTTPDIISSGVANYLNCLQEHHIIVSGSGQIGMNYTLVNTFNINQICVTNNSSIGGLGLNFCAFTTGSVEAITIGSGASFLMSECIVNSNATNVITGAGTLRYTPISFIGNGKTVTVSTQTPLPIGPKIGCTFANVNGTIYYDGTELNSVSPGAAAQVYTSNGAGSPPSFQAASAGLLTPNSIVQISDDFLHSLFATGTAGQLNWVTLNSIQQQDTTDPNHPGVWSIGNAESSDDAIELATNKVFLVGGGEINYSTTLQLSALSDLTNTYILYVGMTNELLNATITALSDGIYFSYNNLVNSGNWVLNCMSSTVLTSVNTSTPATTSYVALAMVIAADGSSVDFYIDNVLQGSISTNIPTTGIIPMYYDQFVAGVLPNINIDLFMLSETLTTPRLGFA
jgi:hypothetical protein